MEKSHPLHAVDSSLAHGDHIISRLIDDVLSGTRNFRKADVRALRSAYEATAHHLTDVPECGLVLQFQHYTARTLDLLNRAHDLVDE